ncbi:hypothetical protein [Legionella drancourtii]|jgi:hypothetical protein|uniref:Uncharacterized protein n=1 Tax=Legionella drancourtii LLAP12 TaxID=658187 RepID=G9EQA9_9GAMM|nr:hypothetical protein [Legionella drancourtii]EHL30504.1 hypothetical protein LDG_7456 [Legionella drancourtii LLAP12]
MISKVDWTKIAWTMLRFSFKLVLITLQIVIEIGFDSNQKRTHPFGKIEARSREENGHISPGAFSRIMND